MAASQYLRPGNLVDTMKSYLTPDLVRNASSLVGESDSSTLSALHTAVPGLLGGLLNFSSTHEGASTLSNMAGDGRFGAVLDNPASLFSGGGTTSNMMSVGQSLVGKIFGNKASSVSDAIASSSGVKSSSASSLMYLLAPLTLGVVGKMASTQGSSIGNLLHGHKEDIAAASPSGLSQALGFGGGPRVAAPVARYEEKVSEKVSGVKNWLPLLLVGIVALGLLLYFLSRGRGVAERAADTARGALSSISLPGGVNLSVPQGSINYNLAQYLANGSQGVPKTFVFDHLNFESASTSLTSDSGQTITGLATILKAYPNAQIRLTGHTDNTGSPQANQQLSVNRANAVKAMLVNDGISADRVSTAGFGQDQPLASNDSEEGRAKNRRTELTVTSK